MKRILLCFTFIITVVLLSAADLSDLHYTETVEIASGTLIRLKDIDDFTTLIDEYGISRIFTLVKQPEAEDKGSEGANLYFYFLHQGTTFGIDGENYLTLFDFIEGRTNGFPGGIEYHDAHSKNIKQFDLYSYFLMNRFENDLDMLDAITLGFRDSAQNYDFLPLPRRVVPENKESILERIICIKLLEAGDKSLLNEIVKIKDSIPFDRWFEGRSPKYKLRDDLTYNELNDLYDEISAKLDILGFTAHPYIEQPDGSLLFQLALKEVITADEYKMMDSSEQEIISAVYSPATVNRKRIYKLNDKNFESRYPDLALQIKLIQRKHGVTPDNLQHLMRTAGHEDKYTLLDSDIYYFAKLAGYPSSNNLERYIKIVRLGFEDFDEYDEARDRGFENRIDYIQAMVRKFKNMDEFKEASSLGFDSWEQYDTYNRIKGDVDIFQGFYGLENYAPSYFYLFLSQLESRKLLSVEKLYELFVESFDNYSFFAENGDKKNYIYTLAPELEKTTRVTILGFLENEEIVGSIGEFDSEGLVFKKY
jgi:hypothetical protein